MKNKNTAGVCVLIGFFLFYYIFNYFNPLNFGDDYLYSFVWQGKSMYIPLTEDAVRVSSWRDLSVSQWSLYLTWGGRTPGQTLTQIFLWWGKDIFNIFNAFAGVMLVAEIYWCANKGRVDLDFRPALVCWVFFALWAFSFGFSTVFFWLTGACIYLWPAVFLLGFMIPYIKKYYYFDEPLGTTHLFKPGMFFLGLIAGWGNENSICWIILVILIFLYSVRKDPGKETWMYTGLAGLLLGYSLLMSAPGNVARLHEGYNLPFLTLQSLKNNLYIFSITVTFQLFLWYFALKSLYRLRGKDQEKHRIKDDLLLVKTLCIVSSGMTTVMLLSPFFPPRSSFPGTVQLIIAVSILLRMQKTSGIVLIPIRVQRFLAGAGILYFIMTVAVTFSYAYETSSQMNAIIDLAKQAQLTSKNSIVAARPIKGSGAVQDFLSGFHLSYYDYSEDENDWGNVAFARYYGIKGIRKIKINEMKEKTGKKHIKTESAPAGPQSR